MTDEGSSSARIWEIESIGKPRSLRKQIIFNL